MCLHVMQQAHRIQRKATSDILEIGIDCNSGLNAPIMLIRVVLGAVITKGLLPSWNMNCRVQTMIVSFAKRDVMVDF
jgi:hypothetical protein